ncbi:MAG: NAD(P)H-hydrate dehydratase [Pseudomonadota bacterium]
MSICPLPPSKLYRTSVVREFDRVAIEQHGIAGIVLMKRAAMAMLQLAQQRWPHAEQLRVVCGGGNNGGDGYLFAALAAQRALEVEVLSLRPCGALKGDALLARQMAEQADVRIIELADGEDIGAWLASGDLLIDALLGTGLGSAVRADCLALIENMVASELPILSADVPSGLNSDTGEIMGAAVKADCTISFVALKSGLMTASGRACCGDIFLSDLAIPPEVFADTKPLATLLNLVDQLTTSPRREQDSHKGSHGHVLIVGGDIGMGGAAVLAASSALASGAGLVSVATREEHVAAIIARHPEVMARSVRSATELDSMIAACDCVVVGPGLGQSSWGAQLLHRILTTRGNKRLVIDADALNLIAQHDWFVLLTNADHIATPHPGEAARLLACTNREVLNDRYAAVNRLVEKLNGHVLLKGSGTLMAGPDMGMSVCPYGNAGMASGGMGDVLSGIVGALCAQNMPTAHAMQLACTLHSAAADYALEQGNGPKGLRASDLAEHVSGFLNHPARAKPPQGIMRL